MVSLDDELNQVFFTLKFFKLLLLLSQLFQPICPLGFQSLFFPQLFGIIMAISASMKIRLVAGHHFSFLPQQSSSNKYIKCIINSAFDVVLILDPAFSSSCIRGDFAHKSISYLFIPGNVQFRNNDIN